MLRLSAINTHKDNPISCGSLSQSVIAATPIKNSQQKQPFLIILFHHYVHKRYFNIKCLAIYMEFYDSSTLWKTLSRRWTINIALPISLHCSSNDLAQKITHTVTAIKAGPSNIFVMYSSILHEFTTGVKCLILAIIYVNHSMKMWCSISWCRRPQDPDKVPSFPIGLWLLSDTYYARSPRLSTLQKGVIQRHFVYMHLARKVRRVSSCKCTGCKFPDCFILWNVR